MPPLWVGILIGTAGCGSSAPANTTEKYFAAQAAANSGDRQKALQLLDEYIAANAVPYAYLERAKVHVALGDDAKAIADCKAGLKLHPENSDLKWCLAELKKKPELRFQGKQATPPSRYK